MIFVILCEMLWCSRQIDSKLYEKNYVRKKCLKTENLFFYNFRRNKILRSPVEASKY